MKTAREVIEYCYGHGRTFNYERRCIAIRDLDKIENENKDLLGLLENVLKGVDIDLDSCQALWNEINNEH